MRIIDSKSSIILMNNSLVETIDANKDFGEISHSVVLPSINKDFNKMAIDDEINSIQKNGT